MSKLPTGGVITVGCWLVCATAGVAKSRIVVSAVVARRGVAVTARA
jgi:hypothetical protein